MATHDHCDHFIISLLGGNYQRFDEPNTLGNLLLEALDVALSGYVGL